LSGGKRFVARNSFHLGLASGNIFAVSRAIDDLPALRRGHLRQRVQLHALIERGSGNIVQVIAEGFATGGGAADVALALACCIGCCRSEDFTAT
jgi:hypothetical protein